MVKLYRWLATGAWHLESQHGEVLAQAGTCEEVMGWAARVLNIQDWHYGTQGVFFVSYGAERGTFIGMAPSPAGDHEAASQAA